MCPVFPPSFHRLPPLVLFPLPAHGSFDWQHCHHHGLSISLQASPVGLHRPRLSVHPRTRGQIQESNGHQIHCKKGWRFSRPQPGCHLPNSPWPEKIYLFPARESLVCDIPAGDGKIGKLLLQSNIAFQTTHSSFKNQARQIMHICWLKFEYTFNVSFSRSVQCS